MNRHSVNIILVLVFTTFVQGCTIIPPKQKLIVGSGTMYGNWQEEVLEKCQSKAWEVTEQLVVEKSKQGVVFTESMVIDIHNYLVKKCSMNSGLVI